MKNYCTLHTTNPFRKYYMFIDEKAMASGRIFERFGLRVKVLSDYTVIDRNFRFVFCSVPRKDAVRLERALRELKWDIIDRGEAGYEDFCMENVTPMQEMCRM